MHLLDRTQYRRFLREARRQARETPGAEICGLIVHTGHHLSFVQVRNTSRRPGSFQLSWPDVRRIVAASKILQQEVVGTFHSHPAYIASPGPSDIAQAADDSLMFIFDCIGNEGRLWHIKHSRSRELTFKFLHSERPSPNNKGVYCCGAKRSQQIHPWLNKPHRNLRIDGFPNILKRA